MPCGLIRKTICIWEAIGPGLWCWVRKSECEICFLFFWYPAFICFLSCTPISIANCKRVPLLRSNLQRLPYGCTTYLPSTFSLPPHLSPGLSKSVPPNERSKVHMFAQPWGNSALLLSYWRSSPPSSTVSGRYLRHTVLVYFWWACIGGMRGTDSFSLNWGMMGWEGRGLELVGMRCLFSRRWAWGLIQVWLCWRLDWVVDGRKGGRCWEGGTEGQSSTKDAEDIITLLVRTSDDEHEENILEMNTCSRLWTTHSLFSADFLPYPRET